ncbi:restriction endonuclease, SacI family [Paenibacillus sp. BIC5C1]|uniref:restriction endonuclease, SacI family n=1 Tax=Paenibacillus sp. BIC5C1 TaxID=3078263 RepID=UPI0028EC9244|nr:restriction endonuclease, SacI family [Paenibacillus sp. BIC5C1]
MNYDLANKILLTTLDHVKQLKVTPNQQDSNIISMVLKGSNKTYKYIMVNAFLAKATDPTINPLCLQKKSKLQGAYDARTLCHKVLVKFERDHLKGALGLSNEPFLNNPARFEELSIHNAVRGGKDRETLELLCKLLPLIDTSDKALIALAHSLYILIQIGNEKEELISLQTTRELTYIELDQVLEAIISESFGGENLVLVIGSLLKLHSQSLIGENIVETHIVNQSGSSSKEIGDVDVYHNGSLIYAIEAKDKLFSRIDVQHAVNKAAENNCPRFTFIMGPRAELVDSTKEIIILEARSKGVLLNIIHINEFKSMLISQILPTSKDSFFTCAKEVLSEARMSEKTVNHLLRILENHHLLSQ